MHRFPQRIITFRSPASRPSRRRNRPARSFEQLEQRHALTAGINDAPQGGDAVFAINEDSTYSFTAASFGFTDPIDAAEGAAHSMSAVLITVLPVAGALSLNGSPVTAGQRIPVTSLSTGTGLTFTPAANAFGSPYASIAFRVQDNGGTVSGGIDIDPTSNTIAINVLPVNDAPTIAPISGPTYVSPTDTTAVARGQIHAADIDPGTTLTYGLESPTVDNGVIASQVGKYGTLYVVKATGAYEFHPNSDAINGVIRNATESFTIVTSDAFSITSATFPVAVVARNSAPELVGRSSVATTQRVINGYGPSYMAQQSDEKIIVAGMSGYDLCVVRYNTFGVADSSFGDNGAFVDPAYASAGGLAIQPDGKIVVAGSIPVRGTVNHNLSVSRLLPDGTLDATFGNAGVYKLVSTQIDTSKAHAVAIQNDGKIVVVGFADTATFASSAVNYDIVVVRLNPDGTADRSFSSDGVATFYTVTQGGYEGSVDRAHAVAIQPDGQILVGGTSDTDVSSLSATHKALLLRLNADGSKDNSFGLGGARTFTVSGTSETLNTVNSIALTQDGSVLLSVPKGIVRVSSGGTVDSGFGSTVSGIATDSFLTLDGSGRMLIGSNKAIYRLTAGGILDATFGLGGVKSTQLSGPRILVQPDGRLLLGTHGGLSLQRFYDNGYEDKTFGDLAGRTQGTALYTEGSNPTVIAPNAGVTDPELTPLNAGRGDFSGSSVTVRRSTQPDSSDVFGFALGTTSSITAPATFAVSHGHTLLAGGLEFGSVSQSDGSITIHFDGDGTGGTTIPTTALVNDVLQRITYRNTSVVPPPSVELTWTFSDGNTGSQGGGGSLTATGTSIINITPTNSAPLSVSFANATTTLTDNTSTAARIKVADIIVEDDGMGTNALSIASGFDGGSFEIIDQALYLKAGVTLNRVLKPAYSVRVEVMDASVPFSTVAATFTLNIVRSAPTRPAAIGALMATPGNQRVTLSWSPPADDGGTPIVNYEIMVAEHTAGVWSSYRPVSRPASTATSADVTGLANGKPHIFVVRAVNAAGASPWVTLAKVVTPIGSRPGVISALTAAAGNQRVSLAWTAPASDGGTPITNYEIMVAEQTGGVWSSYRPVFRPASTATSADVSGLAYGKPHIFVVRAVNAAGVSPWVTLAKVVTPIGSRPGVISALTAAAGNQRVTLAWTAPASDGGTPITNYEIMIAEQTGGVWSSYRPVSRPASTATSADVTGLANGKPHIFVVRAVNAAGASPWVTLSKVATPMGTIPGAVSALRATAGRQQVTLNWAAPTDDGGSPVTNYEIMVAEQTGGVWSSYRTVSRPASTATSAVVSGLSGGKIHIFVVRAVNARGAGRWQTLTPTVTPLA